MKFLAEILLTVAIVLGALAASSAYVVSLDNEDLQELTLKAPAGFQVEEGQISVDEETDEPFSLLPEDTILTEEHIVALRAQRDDANLAFQGRRVTRVHVKEFSFIRWEGKWMFFLALALLIAGGLMLRASSRREIMQAAAVPVEGGYSYEQALNEMHRVVNALTNELPDMPDDASRNHAIVSQLGVLQRDVIPQFVDARNTLIAKLGLAGFAALMDRFAAGERQINRAWSAAADDCYPEAFQSVQRSIHMIEEAMERLA